MLIKFGDVVELRGDPPHLQLCVDIVISLWKNPLVTIIKVGPETTKNLDVSAYNVTITIREKIFKKDANIIITINLKTYKDLNLGIWNESK